MRPSLSIFGVLYSLLLAEESAHDERSRIERFCSKNGDPNVKSCCEEWEREEIKPQYPLSREKQERSGGQSSDQKTVPRKVWVIWLGAPMTGTRFLAFKSLTQNIGVVFELVTSDNVMSYEVPGHPFHPAVKYSLPSLAADSTAPACLSAIHAGDYLRGYFMHHYGGGYHDVKPRPKNSTWEHYFDRFRDPDLWALGIKLSDSSEKEFSCRDSYFSGVLVCESWRLDLDSSCCERLRRGSPSEWAISNGAYIMRPKTRLTYEWLRNVECVLSVKFAVLKKHPAPSFRCCQHPEIHSYGSYAMQRAKLAYPIRWAEFHGEVFHVLNYKFRDHIQQGLPKWSIDVPYRSKESEELNSIFLSEIREIFKSYPPAKEWTILQFNSYRLGHTTSHFSTLFRKVIAVDSIFDHFQMNQLLHRNRTNIEYVHFNSQRNNWAILDKYKIDVVLVDNIFGVADQEGVVDQETVTNDINHLLTMKQRPGVFIFDEYSANIGVNLAVNTFVDFGILMCNVPIGEWDMLTAGGPQAVLCTTEKLDWVEDIRIKKERTGRQLSPRRKKKREAFDHARLNQTVPHKVMDYWTMTRTFQIDLEKFLITNHGAARDWTVLEIGSYVGYTTSIIAPLVKKIVAVDILPQFLEYGKIFNEKYENIDYIPLDTRQGNWSVLDKYNFDVAIIDGAQKLDSVIIDVHKVLQLKPMPEILILHIFDSYRNKTIPDVVDKYESVGALKCVMELGQKKMKSRKNEPKDRREAVLCRTTGVVPLLWSSPVTSSVKSGVALS